MAEAACAHHQREGHQDGEATCLRDVREDGRAVAPSAHVPELRRHALLRFLAQSPRVEACARHEPSGHHVRRARRTMALLLSGRCLRRVRKSKGQRAKGREQRAQGNSS